MRVPLQTRYRKFAESTDGVAHRLRHADAQDRALLRDAAGARLPAAARIRGAAGQPALGARLAERYPLILTCAKSTLFCESQHRDLPSLRRRAPDPEVELHPEAAAARGIEAGDWVRIETPDGSVRARAKFNDSLAVGVVCGQHGWWQPCAEIGAPGYDPFGADGANLNLIIDHTRLDPISGGVPHRAYACQVVLAEQR